MPRPAWPTVTCFSSSCVPDQSGQGQALGLPSTSLVEVKVQKVSLSQSGMEARSRPDWLETLRSNGKFDISLKYKAYEEVQSYTSIMIVHVVRGSVGTPVGL
jgi:hypothetical protein